MSKDSRLFTGSIDVTKIDKDKLFKGKKGTYMNVAIWLNPEPDQYGNDISIQQQTKQGEEKIYLGNAKEFDHQGMKDQDNEDPLPF